jgi:hypothetical protein
VSFVKAITAVALSPTFVFTTLKIEAPVLAFPVIVVGPETVKPEARDKICLTELTDFFL